MNTYKIYNFIDFINEILTYDSTIIDSPYKHNYNTSNNNDYKEILDQLGVTGYVISENGDVDVHGDVNITGKLIEFGYKYIPIKFGVIYGNFNVSGNDLDDFVRFPKYIHGDLDISNNKFQYLFDTGGYNKNTSNFMTVNGDLIVNRNPLKTLEKYFTVNGNIISNINNINNNLDKTKTIRQKLINNNIIKQPGYHWGDAINYEKSIKQNTTNNKWFDYINDYSHSMINNNTLNKVPDDAWLNLTAYEWDRLFINNIRGVYNYWNKYGHNSKILDYNDIKYIEKKHNI